MKKLTKNLLSWSAGALILVSPTPSLASTLLIDRGLPTTNLNLATSNRSNTCWVDPRNKAYDTNYDLIGDTITNTSSTDYRIDKIRLWAVALETVGTINTASLWGGPHGGTLNLLNASPTVTRVYYINGQNLGVLGRYAIHQLDFAVAITLKSGRTFDFFLDGSIPIPPFAPFVHASNAALSGSTQEGADNLMLMVDFKHGALSNVRTWDSNDKKKDYWNKSTDVNVQVFGEVLGAGSTVAALAPTGGFLPALLPDSDGVTVEPSQPSLEALTSFALVQLGMMNPLTLPFLTLLPYPVYPFALEE
jgi:hypothetical protein